MLDGQKVPGQGRGQNHCFLGPNMSYVAAQLHQVLTRYLSDKAPGRKSHPLVPKGHKSWEKPGKSQLPLLLLSTGTSMISSISKRVIFPSPSRSYISKAQLSFCSKVPLEVTLRAQMNSLKSMVPSPFLSKVRNACWANLEASP